MKLFYDHQAFSLQQYGGVSRIFAELYAAFKNDAEVDCTLGVWRSNNVHLKEKGFQNFKFFETFQFPKKNALLYRINSIQSLIDMRLASFDIYHPTYYGTDLLKSHKRARIVSTFHDMIHEKYGAKFPELHADKKVIQQKKILAAHSDHLIAVSENTKRDIIELLGVKPDKITVIHLGSSMVPSAAKRLSEKPYLLYVGNRAGYKNFLPMLKAIASTLTAKELRVICAGGGQFSDLEKHAISELKLEHLVAHAKINDQTLAEWYANATAFIFPSLYEGFGIPVTEAFSCGCPCLLSSAGSLPEVGGNAAMYFDPHQPESMKATLEAFLDDGAAAGNMVAVGYERLKLFSWQHHVAQTKLVYESLL